MIFWPGRLASRCGSISRMSLATSRSSALALARAKAIGRPEEVQAQPPEVPGVAGAVPIASKSGKVGALGGWPGPPALHRGGVNHPEVVEERVGVAGEDPDQGLQLGDRFPDPLVVARLSWQVGEGVNEVHPGMAKEPGVGDEARSEERRVGKEC